MGFIIKLLLTGVAAVVASYILPGVHIDTFLTAIILALVLALLNAIVKPLLVILTIPVTVITLGLFLLVINAIIILLADYLVAGFDVSGFISALLFGIVMAIVSAILDFIF